MSWGAVAAVAAVGGLGQSVSSSHQAKKGRKHARERAVGKARELEAEEASETRTSKAASRSEKVKRLTGYERNLNIFAGGFGGPAAAARKTLTGQ